MAVSDEPGETLSLSRLVALTGVPASTIHHYRRCGLVPEPQRAGPNRFVYDRRHVEAVMAARSRKTSGHDDSRARIVATAVEAFRTRSYAEVSMADIAEAAGMAKGNLYRFFPSKEALLSAAIEALLADTNDRFANAVESMGGPGGLADDPDKAALALGFVVADVLPILLELGARAAKGHEPSATIARHVLRTLAATAGRPFVPAGTDDPAAVTEVGLGVIQRAFATVLTWSAGDDWPPDQISDRRPANSH